MTLEKVKELLAEHLDIDASEISGETSFEDLGIDSLDTVEIIMELEEEFGIEIKSDEIVKTVNSLVEYIDSKKE